MVKKQSRKYGKKKEHLRQEIPIFEKKGKYIMKQFLHKNNYTQAQY